MNKGFTLVELIVTISIFVFMSVLLMVKYGNFNQSVLLTNMAYDLALVIRTAQTYGISVRSTTDNSDFDRAYGVNLSTKNIVDARGSLNTKIIFFADLTNNYIFDGVSGGDSIESIYNLSRGAKISKICVGDSSSNCTVTPDVVNVSFKRPDPKAIICNDSSCYSDYPYMEITLEGTDGGQRKISVNRTGQVSILQ